MSTDVKRSGLLVVILWSLGCAAMDDGVPPPPNLGPPLLEVHNQGTGDDRPLEQLLLHSALGNYRGARNRLEAPLAVGESVVIADFTPGTYYLTVVRKQLSLPVSDLVALTTAQSRELTAGRYVVWVFDESFRFYEPTPNYDGGVPPDATVDFLFDVGPLDAGVDGDVGPVPTDATPDGDGQTPTDASPDGDAPPLDGASDVGPDADATGPSDAIADGADI